MKSRPGRPKLPRNIRQLIVRMVEENPTWGRVRCRPRVAADTCCRRARESWLAPFWVDYTTSIDLRKLQRNRWR
jgi:hypothetical protein